MVHSGHPYRLSLRPSAEEQAHSQEEKEVSEELKKMQTAKLRRIPNGGPSSHFLLLFLCLHYSIQPVPSPSTPPPKKIPLLLLLLLLPPPLRHRRSSHEWSTQ
jgi:hypothetical protein